MSEAELHVLKQRMLEGKKAKAYRGELVTLLPRGYVRHLSGEIIKDPDEQVQSVIVLTFDLFDRLLSISGVLKYFAKHQIRLPDRERCGLQKGDLRWCRPNASSLKDFFHNPMYAGAYAYGRNYTDPRRKKPGRPCSGVTAVKQSEWAVLIKDKLPAYITWEQYERNVRQLTANATRWRGVSDLATI